MPRFSFSTPSEMLSAQMDFIVKDYFSLLAVAGAAARLIQDWDVKDLPAHLVNRAELLSLTLNNLPELLFQEALDAGYTAGLKRAQIRHSVYQKNKEFFLELSSTEAQPRAEMHKKVSPKQSSVGSQKTEPSKKKAANKQGI